MTRVNQLYATHPASRFFLPPARGLGEEKLGSVLPERETGSRSSCSALGVMERTRRIILAT